MGCGGSKKEKTSDENVKDVIEPAPVEAFEALEAPSAAPIQPSPAQYQAIRASYEQSMLNNPEFFYNEEVMIAEALNQSIMEQKYDQ